MEVVTDQNTVVIFNHDGMLERDVYAVVRDQPVDESLTHTLDFLDQPGIAF